LTNYIFDFLRSEINKRKFDSKSTNIRIALGLIESEAMRANLQNMCIEEQQKFIENVVTDYCAGYDLTAYYSGQSTGTMVAGWVEATRLITDAYTKYKIDIANGINTTALI